MPPQPPSPEAGKTESLLSEARLAQPAAGSAALASLRLPPEPSVVCEESGYEFQSNGVIEMLEKLEVQFKEER